MASKPLKTTWKWTTQRDEAALLVSHDDLSDAKICATVGINQSTLYIWKNTPEFAQRVEEHIAAARAAIRAKGIAIIENRVARKHADWERLEAIRRARAEAALSDPELLAEGGETGLVVRKQRLLGSGPTATLVTDYSIDTSYLAERDRLEEGVARELGQRIEKHEVETRDLTVAEGLDGKIDALARRLQAAQAKLGDTDADGASAGPSS